MIKRRSMMMVGNLVEGQPEVNVWQTRRCAAHQQDAQGGNTHDSCAVGNQSADAFPEVPDKPHVHTLLPLDDFTAVSVHCERIIVDGCGHVRRCQCLFCLTAYLLCVSNSLVEIILGHMKHVTQRMSKAFHFLLWCRVRIGNKLLTCPPKSSPAEM